MCSESNLMFFVIGQGDEVFGQGIVTLFGKPANQQDSELMPQRIVLPELDELFWGERDCQTVFNEYKTTLAHGKENSKKRKQYIIYPPVNSHFHTHTHTHTHTL